MLENILQLEDTHPEVCQSFVDVNLLVQLSDKKTFGRINRKRCINMSINMDTKMPRGTTGFSTNLNSIIRWSINAIYQLQL